MRVEFVAHVDCGTHISIWLDHHGRFTSFDGVLSTHPHQLAARLADQLRGAPPERPEPVPAAPEFAAVLTCGWHPGLQRFAVSLLAYHSVPDSNLEHFEYLAHGYCSIAQVAEFHDLLIAAGDTRQPFSKMASENGSRRIASPDPLR
ncbi:MAG: hypothetical protein JWR83_3608 [Aeromicrobium sp.]|nr:hypothetical protein [Aeromicrobium sp.]